MWIGIDIRVPCSKTSFADGSYYIIPASCQREKESVAHVHVHVSGTRGLRAVSYVIGKIKLGVYVCMRACVKCQWMEWIDACTFYTRLWSVVSVGYFRYGTYNEMMSKDI